MLQIYNAVLVLRVLAVRMCFWLRAWSPATIKAMQSITTASENHCKLH